jgi:O-antigen ligase
MKSNSLLLAGGLLSLVGMLAMAALVTGEMWHGAVLLLAAAPAVYVAGKYSLKTSLVVVLLLIILFLPNRFDTTWVLLIRGSKLRFVTVATFLVDGILLIQVVVRASIGSLWPTRRVWYYLVAAFLLLGSILLSLLWAVAGGSLLARRVEDALPVIAPLMLCVLLNLQEWSREEIWFLAFVENGGALAVSALSFVVGAGFTPFFQMMGWHSVRAWAERPHQAVGSAIAAGAILLAYLPLSLALYETSRARWKRVFYLFCGGAMLGSIVLGASRLILGLALLYLLRPARRIVSKTAGRVLQYVAVAAVVVFIALSAGRHSYFRRYTQFENPSTRSRELSAWTALLVIRDHPFLGTGLGTVYVRGEERLKYGLVEMKGLGTKLMVYKGHTTLAEPHDVYLMWLAELGIVGFSTLVFFGVVLSRHLLSALRGRAGPSGDNPLLKGFFWGVVLFAAQMVGSSMLLNNLRASVVFWINLALALELATQKLALSEPQVWRRGWAAAGPTLVGEARHLPVHAAGNARSSAGSL